MRALSADLFCRVIDNLGDIGVMWRLARQLHDEKGWQIRLWVDDLKSLGAIEPMIDRDKLQQVCRHVDVRQWPAQWGTHLTTACPLIEPNPIVIAGFSCDLPPDYLKALAQQPTALWLQLEYLSAQDWVESFHGLSSLRNDGLKPVFFFPGFTLKTGGLLRETELLAQRDQWIAQQEGPHWLSAIGVTPPDNPTLVSVFTYPTAPIHSFIEQLQQTGKRYHLLIPSTQPLPADRLPKQPKDATVTWQTIKFLSQSDYDRLLWSCELNLVRGEDSLVRAIWAGKPLLWQIYPQTDGAHHDKLKAWLALANPPATATLAMHEWADGQLHTDLSPVLAGDGWQQWRQSSRDLCDRLAEQSDLATRLDTLARHQLNS